MHMSSSLVSHGHGPTALQCFQTLHRKGIIPVKVTCALLFPRYHQRPPRSRSFAGLPLPDLGSRSVLDAWELLYVSEDKSTVSVQWVKKVKDKYILHENSDSSPYISSVPYESIMFTDVLRNISETGERNGPYVLDGTVRQEIMKAYKDRDESNI